MSNILVECKGGLGNQLHCYFFFKILSIIKKKKIKFDIGPHHSDPHKRKYLLNRIINNKIEIIENNFSFFSKIKKNILRFVSFFLPLKYKLFINDNGIYNSKILKTNYFFNPIFSGYWQSYRYYNGFEKLIREEIKIPYIKNKKADILYKKIKKKESCFVHFRSYNEEYSNRLSINYYKNALNFISKRKKKVIFYVFSDDIKYAKFFFKNIDQKLFFIEISEKNNEKKTFIEFNLMVNCKHSIIGDSTFSWWAAWIRYHKKKIIICPKGLVLTKKHWTPKNWIKFRAK